ncbi:MAG: hypothetical protein J0L84_11830 [Verrucomicrobia bacterium]|nr:hypothetical protein [Verrucomicrobiota bacterium]
MPRNSRIEPVMAVLALLLSAASFVPRDPLTGLETFAESLPGPAGAILDLVILPLRLLSGFSFMLGTALLALLIWRRVGMGAPRTGRFQPLLLPVLGLIWLVVQAAPFFTVPAGGSIRPMGWALYVFMSALTLACGSVLNTLSAFKNGGNRVVCSLAMLLSLTMVVIPSLSLHAVARLKGFTLAP